MAIPSSNYSMRRPMHHQNAGRGRQIAVAVVLILLFVAIGIVAFSANGAPTITSVSSFNVGTGSTLNFMVQNSSRTFALYMSGASSSGAQMYISSYPVLANPIISVSASPGSSLNISTLGTGTANINLKVVSSNSSGARVQLTPIPLGLSIPASQYATVINPSPLPVSGSSLAAASTTATTTATTTAASTTTISSSGSSTVSTSIATTTITQVPASIWTLANSTYIGVLVNNLNKLYASGATCTPSLYSQTFQLYTGFAPVPPFDWINASQTTPTSISTSITLLTSSLYVVNYTAVTLSPATRGLVISYDLSSSGTLTNIVFTGLFAHENYTQVLSGYNAQDSIQNACAPFIPPR